MKKFILVFILTSHIFVENATAQMFSTSDYLLLQGKFVAWFAANLIAQLGPGAQRTKTIIMLVSSIMVPLSDQISLQSLKSILEWAGGRFRQDQEFWEQVKEISKEEVSPYQDYIFNPITKKELDAVIYRALNHAQNHQKQSTILLYGEPGTGKTGVGESLSHWPQFKVYRIPSQILSKASHFRIASSLCEANDSGKVNVILVDDAEFFLRALTPGSSNYHSTSQEELESEFRTQLGGDSARCLWFFTSNEVAELEGDTKGAIRRRFKNEVWIRRPDGQTFIKILQKFTQDAISQRNIRISENALNNFEPNKLVEYAETISPDALRQIAENAVSLAINEETNVIETKHWQFFLDARSQSEEWILKQAEKEFQNKKRKLERMVAIKLLEKQLEPIKTEAKSSELQ